MNMARPLFAVHPWKEIRSWPPLPYPGFRPTNQRTVSARRAAGGHVRRLRQRAQVRGRVCGVPRVRVYALLELRARDLMSQIRH